MLNFLDHSAPSAPAGDDAAGKPAAKEAKKDDHRQLVIVLASIIGVVIAWFSYRAIKGGSSASASGTTVSSASVPGTTSGTVAGYGSNTDAYNGFTSYLQNLGTEVTALSNQINTQANSTATLPATPPSALAGYQVPYVTGDPNQDYAIANSSEVAGAYAALGKPNLTPAQSSQYLSQYWADEGGYVAQASKQGLYTPVAPPKAT